MHAASIALLAWAMIGAACCFPASAAIPVGGLLAALVAVVGLPHGAADHRYAKRRFEPLLGPMWGSVFFPAYLAIAAAVVVGWFVAPAVTILAFFLTSAWHFGREDPELVRVPRRARCVRPLFRLARGGLVIWVPVAFQTDEVVRILALTAPHGMTPQVKSAVDALVVCSWALLTIEAVAVIWQSRSVAASQGRRRRVLLLDIFMLVSLVLMLTWMNPIAGFLVYFCGWHSARGLRRLRRELGESWRELAMSLAPLTTLSIGLIALTTCVVLQAPTWNDTLIRATFVGLSSVAVPHLVLHGVGPLCDRFTRHQAAPTIGWGSAT
ncbi:MAG: hypothetical protein EBR86_04980 [Planctomycetia bacterium]|nr:hypothetical protein [Planctomycetia bacterium]